MAIGPQQRMYVLRIRYAGNWDANPGAGKVLCTEVGLRTSVSVSDNERVVALTDPQMASSMFAILTGDRAFTFTQAERTALKRWLGLGGFMVFDNTGLADASAGFDTSVRRELGLLFPQQPLARVSPEHVIFRSFYRVDYPAGRAIHRPYLEGVTLGRRYAAVLNPNDLTGALAQNALGAWASTPVPGGARQREMAMRFGTNLAMYAQCLHYKDDQVHLDYLLHSRKWKIDPPKAE